MGFVFKKMSEKYAGLAWKFHVSPDSCDNHEHYETFLRLNALSEQASGRGVTHILIETDEGNETVSDTSRIAGFITLRATSLAYTCDGKSYVKPSLEIAELAVDMDYERRGIGSKLVDVAIYIASQLNEQFIGIQNVVLCADPKAVGFYENPKVGFGKLEDFYDVLRDGWNDNCTPMYINLCPG